MGNYKFILSGGGTGGHIFPALAIADELKRRHPDAQFLFVGARDRMEMEKVPKAGYEIEGLWISGIDRRLTLRNLLFPFKLISSLVQANSIVRKFRPHVAIGTGGFASGPLLRMAARRKVPCLIQEQNSFAGITNKLLAPKVDTVCVAYDGMERFFPSDKIVKTGNPVRAGLESAASGTEAAYAHFDLSPDKTTVLLLGGSLGARRMNELVAARLPLFARFGIQVLWQCGKLYIDTYREYTSETVKVHEFINRMDLAYGVADIIISRAGAGTVSELCLAGKPVILIPSPHVAEDHQTKNARALVAREAALMLAETELDTRFESVFSNLYLSEKMRNTLAGNIRKEALPEATARIADEIEKLIPPIP